MGRVEAPATPEAVATDFVDCYLRHYSRLVRALQLAGASRAVAEDQAQEAFARALARWDRVSQGPNPTGYVYTAGFRLLHRHLARTRKWEIGEEPGDELGTGGRGHQWSDQTASEATTRVSVEEALAAMPPKRRACAVLCLIVGVPTDEAAQALGIAPGTVRKHLEQARLDLR